MIARLEADPAVASVTPTGSRAGGRPTALSDWDYLVTGEPAALVTALPRAVAALESLAAFWDPLSTHAALMVILPGPLKVDLIAEFANPEPRDSWDWAADEVDRINAHFWDWMLWLGAKQLAGRDGLVRAELEQLQHAILAPARGLEPPPASLGEAIERYTAALHARGLGALGRAQLAIEVHEALRRAGVVETGA